jgi:methylenetetrahydrofolate dehydrogenase (NADP+)/methenyltetrahydrofolate cyclohydrolase
MGEVLALIAELNRDPGVDGILVQSPPPPQIDEEAVIAAIDPAKDVDCFCERNVGKLLIGRDDGFRPCTPWGVMLLLESHESIRSESHAR